MPPLPTEECEEGAVPLDLQASSTEVACRPSDVPPNVLGLIEGREKDRDNCS